MSENTDRYSDQWQTIDPTPIIEQAITNLSTDAGAVFEKDVLEAFKTIFQQHPASYVRYRQQIKETKAVSMALFDKLSQVFPNQAQSEENDPLAKLFYPLEIYPDPINPEDLLNDIKHHIKQYIIADDETITVATLWACFTWFIDVVNYAPIANITAPEKRCGKTKLLSVLKRLSYNSLITANISPAALFRLIEQSKPTLLIDEVDSFLEAHEDMRGIINAGFTRESSLIVRCVGDEHQLAGFNVWGAKALCGIGKIADTLQDRSIPLKLRRKTHGETVHNVDKSDPEQWRVLRAKLARFAQDNKLKLLTTQPEPLPQLNDRANDCFEPLLQIACLAGETWLKQAQQAAICLSGGEQEDNSTRTELLNDIKTLFDTKKIDRIFSHELIYALNEDNEANWCTWNRGRGITARNLAKLLKEFGIVSNTIRIGMTERAKGYIKDQFSDAFTRYLSTPCLDTPNLSVTTGQVKGDSTDSQINKRDTMQMSRIEKSLQTSKHSDCHLVTDKTSPSTEKESQLTIKPLHNDQKNIKNIENKKNENNQNYLNETSPINNPSNPNSQNKTNDQSIDEDEAIYFDLD